MATVTVVTDVFRDLGSEVAKALGGHSSAAGLGKVAIRGHSPVEVFGWRPDDEEGPVV